MNMLNLALHTMELAIWLLGFYLLRMGCTSISDKGIQIVMEEVLTTMDLCGAVIELLFMWNVYGEVYFVVGLFLCLLWWCATWGEAEGNPNKYIEEYLKGNLSLTKTAFLIFVQVITAIYTYRFLQYFWQYGLGPEHKNMPLSDECESHIQTSLHFAALAEFLASFIERLFTHLMPHFPLLKAIPHEAAVGTSLCVLTMYLSGGYYNPVLATAIQFGCSGHSHVEFFIVYWVASILGCVLAFYLYTDVMKSYLVKSKAEFNSSADEGLAIK